MNASSFYQQSLLLQCGAGCLVIAVLLVPVRWRYLVLVRRSGIDVAAVSAYWWSGFWLACFLGFVTAFLPAFFHLCAPPVAGFVLLTSILAGQIYRPR